MALHFQAGLSCKSLCPGIPTLHSFVHERQLKRYFISEHYQSVTAHLLLTQYRTFDLLHYIVKRIRSSRVHKIARANQVVTANVKSSVPFHHCVVSYTFRTLMTNFSVGLFSYKRKKLDREAYRRALRQRNETLATVIEKRVQNTRISRRLNARKYAPAMLRTTIVVKHQQAKRCHTLMRRAFVCYHHPHTQAYRTYFIQKQTPRYKPRRQRQNTLRETYSR